MSSQPRTVRLSATSRVALGNDWVSAAQLATRPAIAMFAERLFLADGTMLELDPELAAGLPARLSLAPARKGGDAPEMEWAAGIFAGRGYSGIERRRENGRQHGASSHIWEASTANAEDAAKFEAILRRHGLSLSRSERDGRHVVCGEGFEWSLYWSSMGVDGSGPVSVPQRLWSARQDDVLAFCDGVAVALDPPGSDGLLALDTRRQQLAKELAVLARRAGMSWPLSGTAGSYRLAQRAGECSQLLVERRQRWRSELVPLQVSGPLIVDGLLLA